MKKAELEAINKEFVINNNIMDLNLNSKELGNILFNKLDIINNKELYYAIIKNMENEQTVRFFKVLANQAPYPYNIMMTVSTMYYSHDYNISSINFNINGFNEALKTLKEKEQLFISLYYKYGNTLDEIGKIINRNKEAVRQILEKAKRKLHHPSRLGLFYINHYIKDIFSEDIYSVLESAGITNLNELYVAMYKDDKLLNKSIPGITINMLNTILSSIFIEQKEVILSGKNKQWINLYNITSDIEMVKKEKMVNKEDYGAIKLILRHANNKDSRGYFINEDFDKNMIKYLDKYSSDVIKKSINYILNEQKKEENTAERLLPDTIKDYNELCNKYVKVFREQYENEIKKLETFLGDFTELEGKTNVEKLELINLRMRNINNEIYNLMHRNDKYDNYD